jgi:hypothetical protein
MQSVLQTRFEPSASGEPEAEGMTAAKANVFDPLAPSFVDREEVTNHHAGQRVPDHRERSLCLEERVPAPARVFSRFRSRFHNMDSMAKEPAGVINSFFEFVTADIRVAG